MLYVDSTGTDFSTVKLDQNVEVQTDRDDRQVEGRRCRWTSRPSGEVRDLGSLSWTSSTEKDFSRVEVLDEISFVEFTGLT